MIEEPGNSPGFLIFATNMNNKQTELYRIVDIVLKCTASQIDESGTMTITKEDLLGKSRSENAVMARCILVSQILSAGFSVATAAMLIKRTEKTVRNMANQHIDYLKTSRAYRIADAEATIACKEISAV